MIFLVFTCKNHFAKYNLILDSVISSSEIIGNSNELLTLALAAVAHDKINEIKIDGITTLGNNVRLLALEILNLNNGSRDDFAQQLAEFLFQLLNDYDISRSSE